MKRKILKILLALTVMLGINIRTAVPVHAEGEELQTAVNPYTGGWSNCTWGTWQLVYEATGIALPGWHNAGGWLLEASQAGYAIGTEPRANSIAVWSWHVAYVTDFDGNDSMYIKEGGYLGGYNEEWCPAYGVRWNQQLLGFIYLDADVISNETPETVYAQSLGTHVVFAINSEARSQASLEDYIVMIDDAEAEEIRKTEELQMMEAIRKEDAKAAEKVKAVSLSGNK